MTGDSTSGVRVLGQTANFGILNQNAASKNPIPTLAITPSCQPANWLRFAIKTLDECPQKCQQTRFETVELG
jgi:hypothetical protein